MKKGKISNNVIRRLPRYLRKLDDLTANGITRISSKELGKQLGLTPSQIRQDFSCFGEFGQQGYGYNVTALREQIGVILGINRGYNAILIGVGNIGHAMIDNFCFSNWGCTLRAAFDVNPGIIGTSINGIPVISMDDLSAYIAENKVDIAVLTVPREAAKPVAATLESNGVGAIWNFTNVDLTDPVDEDEYPDPASGLIVENVHFSDSLLSLCYFIGERNDLIAAKQAKAEKTKNN